MRGRIERDETDVEVQAAREGGADFASGDGAGRLDGETEDAAADGGEGEGSDAVFGAERENTGRYFF